MSGTTPPGADPQDVPGDPAGADAGAAGPDVGAARPAQASSGGVRRGAALMAGGTAVSRLLGFLRGMVLALAVGAAGQAADAFAVANKLPNILYMLLAGGVLNAVLVPQVVRAYKRNAGQEYVDRLLTLGFALLGVATLVLTLAAPWLVALFADSGDATQQALTTTFAYWCIPQLFFYGAYALLGQVLNARGSFGPYMWAPVVNNVVAIAGFGVFFAVFGRVQSAQGWSAPQLLLLAGVSTLGVVCQALVLVPALRRAGVRYRWRWGVRGSGLGRAGTVATWTFVGLAIGQIGTVIVSRTASAAPGASALPAGQVAGNAAYDYAFTLFMLPHSLVTVSLATALFTRLSAQANDGDVPAVRGTLSTGLRVVGLFTLLAAAGLVVLGQAIVRIILFSQPEATVNAVAGVVVAMAVGLPAFGAWSMCQRVYYAYEDARSMVPVQVVMVLFVIGGTLLGRALLPGEAWVAAAGLSMSVSYLVGTVLAVRALRRRLGGSVDGPRVLQTHARALVAAAAATGVGLGVQVLVVQLGATGVTGAVVRCAVVGTVMAVVYLGTLRLLRVRELEELLGPIVRRVKGRR